MVFDPLLKLILIALVIFLAFTGSLRTILMILRGVPWGVPLFLFGLRGAWETFADVLVALKQG